MCADLQSNWLDNIVNETETDNEEFETNACGTIENVKQMRIETVNNSVEVNFLKRILQLSLL